MKAYTDLSQSKKLAKILPLESADMRFCFSHTLGGKVIGHYPMIGREPSMGTIPAWSLAALINVLPNENMLVKTTDGEHYCLAKDVMTKHYDNPVDACYEVIVKLKKKNLL